MEIPVARGRRLAWESAPDRVRRRIEEFLGAEVVAAVTQLHGFSPAVAARLRAANGRRAFVKAVPPDTNPDTPGIYRNELAVMRLLPPGIPVPRLLWSLDEGPDGWVVLLFEDVESTPATLPWRRDELRLAVAAIDELARALTPSPTDPERQQGVRLDRHWRRWHQLAADVPSDLDPRLAARLPELVAAESRIRELTYGQTLVHLDIRSDNLLFGGDRCWVVDWAWPMNGAAWVDVVLFAGFVESEGGPPAEEVLALSEVGRAAPEEGVLSLAATFAGMLQYQSRQPAPPGIPGVREFQKAHARSIGGWALRLLDRS